jgi:hypothetical protein
MRARQERAPKRSSSAGHRKTPENSTEFFGHPWPEWYAMRDAAAAHIADRAAEGRTTTYEELWRAVAASVGNDLGTPWRKINRLLGAVVEQALEDGDLIPTALVVHDATRPEGPGPGFFRVAAEYELLPWSDAPPDGEDDTWVMTDRQRAFWEDQVARLLAAATSA